MFDSLKKDVGIAVKYPQEVLNKTLTRLKILPEAGFVDLGFLKGSLAPLEKVLHRIFNVKTIGGIKYIRKSVEYFKNGQVSSGTLAADTIIAGVEYRAGSEVFFNKSGQVLKVR